LERTSAPQLPIAEKGIAVLPFANLSDDKANAYFADGIQDEILTKLSVNEQYARVAELNESVRLFEQLGDTAQN